MKNLSLTKKAPNRSIFVLNCLYNIRDQSRRSIKRTKTMEGLPMQKQEGRREGRNERKERKRERKRRGARKKREKKRKEKGNTKRKKEERDKTNSIL